MNRVGSFGGHNLHTVQWLIGITGLKSLGYSCSIQWQTSCHFLLTVRSSTPTS
uniref:Uncharacterized protein n=1 Tax=Anguilla anguilla TaxID=7936 RepID=A0A0E9V970_ANGAN